VPERDLARIFDRQAALYDRARPGWPAEAVSHALRELGLGRGASVLDLAAGTGRLTQRLVEQVENVIAVEPLEGMRAVLLANAPRATVLDGVAERLPVADMSVDAVFCADAFHWFDPDRALAEIRRVLRPAGGVVLLWNGLARPTEPSVAEAVELLEQRGHPDRRARGFRATRWQERFPEAGFAPVREARFDRPTQTDRGALLGYWQSMSWVAALPASERADLQRMLEGLLYADSYTVFWRTEIFWTRLVT
jgi:SAM-dependent methyltransferase